MQRQVGQHDAVAVRELVHHRLPLAVGEPLRVQQRQRRPGPGLAVRDPRAVGMVVEPQLHGEQLTSPGVGVANSIGRPVRRREDARILSGRSRFLDDIRCRTRCTWRSCAPRMRTPGCIAVRGALLTAAEIAGRAVPGTRRPPPGLDGRARAAPAAGGRRGALRRSAGRGGRGRDRARWPRTPPSASRSTYEPLRAGGRPARRARRWRAGRSARATWRARSRAAAHVVRTEHVIPRLVAVPMEPRGALAVPDGDRLARVVVVAERAPPARAARADPRPRRGVDPRASCPDVGGGVRLQGHARRWRRRWSRSRRSSSGGR